jgi:hypothetical protein
MDSDKRHIQHSKAKIILVNLIVFHWLIGTPFEFNQNEAEGLTLWEQIDNGDQFTPARKYLTAVPILLYFYYLLDSWLVRISRIMISLPL